MWWESESDNDRRVRLAATTIAGRLREGVAVLPFLPAEAVNGVGSILLTSGVRRLLLVVNPEWNFRRLIFSSPFDVHPIELWRLYELLGLPYHHSLLLRWAWWLRSFRPWSSSPWYRMIALPDYPIPLGLLRKSSSAAFPSSDVPDDTILLFDSPPEPLFSGGVGLRSGERRGSVGLAVEISTPGSGPARGFTTAGHVIDGLTVQRSTSLLGVLRRFVDPEEVMLHADCTTDPSADGYDIAVAVSRTPLTSPTSLATAGIADVKETDVTPSPGCTMWGGESGVRSGFLFSAMNVERNGTTWWQNCWRVVGERGWFVKEGDSGAPVTLHGSGRVLGHVVCGVGTKYKGRFEAGLVQDIASQVAHLRQRFNVTLT
jgi:hypothetical protein